MTTTLHGAARERSDARQSAPPSRRAAGRAPRSSEGIRPVLAVAASVFGVAVIGALDYASGPTISFLAFYLIPPAWATVHAGRRAGVATAGLCVLASYTANDLLQAHSHTDPDLWNAALRLVTFLVVVELVHRVVEQARSAREAQRRSQEFLASAAHQLRTPLAGIRSTVDALLLGWECPPEQEQLLVNLSRESARAAKHLSALLRMARLDQHEEVPFRRVAVDQVVRAELERAAATRPGLTWELRPRAADSAVVGNSDAIGEAVANLFDNAARHARTKVEASVTCADGHVEIAVRDDGPGLPAHAAAAAFERFVSLDHCGGTGLGLPIARGIAEAHHGSLDYCDGAFVIRLPRG
ncbi:MAG TPA: HAMP domain-containing sensor histidine kinase [Acidimicrobiales bacterium]|nr:HAMP domain-containing sensor histidine kinase [Acidimicrobiales bacterium]